MNIYPIQMIIYDQYCHIATTKVMIKCNKFADFVNLEQ